MTGHFKRSTQEKEREQRTTGMRRGPRFGGNIEKAKDPQSALKRLLSYFSEYRPHILTIIILTIVSTILSLIGPYLIGVAIDQHIITRDYDGLIRIAIILIGTYAASSVTSMAAGWIMATLSQRSLKKLRKQLFEHIQTLSLSFFDRRPAGDLMSRLTNDIDAIGSALAQNVTELIRNIITLIGIVAIMFTLNLWLALASLVVFPIMVVLTAIVGKRTRSGYRKLQMNMGMLNGVMQETITGQRVVIAFDQQESVNRKFTRLNQNVKEIGIKAMTYAMLVPPLMGILSNANIAIVAGVGSWMALQGFSSVGVIASFISYSRSFANPLRHFANLYNSIQSALAGAERIFEIIDTEPELVDSPNAFVIDDFNGEVEFKDVDFEYVTNVPVLKDINLKAEAGQTIALVGPTGAGKTTIVNVLTRFYDIKDGSIRIDELDIRDVKKDDLRKRLGIVLQDVFLFSGTVMENIRYGRLNASDEECVNAAMLANADGFIKRLPQDYQTMLTEGGSNLSQGQRQLLSIARAIVADPDILILDEATSSVDSRTEMQIQEGLLRLMEGRTSFVIAHRLSTIRSADQVLVINDGEIIERGTHEELLEKRGFYYNLYMSQFKGTREDADFEYIKPVERPEPIQPQVSIMPRMRRGHGMGSGSSSGMMQQRVLEIVNIFKKNGAISEETAKTLNDLGVPPYFPMMVQMKLGPLGIIAEQDGKYYLIEENIDKL
jgi:ATP-binding cassette subfamily B protein